MLTLSSAFRLCDVKNEVVYLVVDDGKRTEEWFWSTRLAETIDMKKLEVVKILPRFENFGPDFLGMQFTVKGITAGELHNLAFKC